MIMMRAVTQRVLSQRARTQQVLMSTDAPP